MAEHTENFAIYTVATGFIGPVGRIKRPRDQIVLDQINNYLSENPGSDVYYEVSPVLPNPETEVIVAGVKRLATEQELAQMPSGILAARQADILDKMGDLKTWTHADLNAWLNSVFEQLPTDEQDALDYINNNVTDLATVKAAMIKIVKALYDQREATRKIANVLLAVLRREGINETD